MIHILAFRRETVFHGEGKNIQHAIRNFRKDYEKQTGVPFMKKTIDEIINDFRGDFRVTIEYIP